MITDIDGVWTDGGMYYDEHENEIKKFNTSDSAGIILLNLADIQVGIITGEQVKSVKRRAAKLGIDLAYFGVKNKLDLLKRISKEKQIPLSEIAYIGDDVPDVPAMQVCGLSACPADAKDYVSRHATWIMNKKGGQGVFREFAERILQEMNLLDVAINKWIQQISQ